MFNPKLLARPNIVNLTAYQSARSQYSGDAILLDANENPFGDGTVNRYPDPYQAPLRQALAKRQQLAPEQILFGNGSDELIDLLIRTFCEPQTDAIVVCPPTFGMYEVSATINAVKVITIPLNSDYTLNVDTIINTSAKILFLPCPNAPTGNVFATQDLENIIQNFKGLVVLDEAYVDFADTPSWTKRLSEFPNLVILQTFSKYWGLAGLRIGMVMASTQIIELLGKVKMPYNLNNASAAQALNALNNESQIRAQADTLIVEKQKLSEALNTFKCVQTVFNSQANFLWIQVKNSPKIQAFLRDAGIVIRGYKEYPDFVRISVGSETENQKIITALARYES